MVLKLRKQETWILIPVSLHLLQLTWASHLISLRFIFLLPKRDVMTDPLLLLHLGIVTIK